MFRVAFVGGANTKIANRKTNTANRFLATLILCISSVMFLGIFSIYFKAKISRTRARAVISLGAGFCPKSQCFVPVISEGDCPFLPFWPVVGRLIASITYLLGGQGWRRLPGPFSFDVKSPSRPFKPTRDSPFVLHARRRSRSNTWRPRHVANFPFCDSAINEPLPGRLRWIYELLFEYVAREQQCALGPQQCADDHDDRRRTTERYSGAFLGGLDHRGDSSTVGSKYACSQRAIDTG